MPERPVDDFIFLHIFRPGLIVPVRGLGVTGIGKNIDIRDFVQNGFFQIADRFLVHTVHFCQDDHHRRGVLFADLADHLLIRFKEAVIGRRDAVPDFMDMLVHLTGVLIKMLTDDTQHVFHVFLLVSSDVIALAVIEGDGRAFGAVGMNAGCPGSSLVPDLRSVNVAELKDVPDQSTLADARRAADQNIGFADAFLHLPELFIVIKVLIIKYIHLFFLAVLICLFNNIFGNNKVSVLKKRPQLFGRRLFSVIDPVLCHLFVHTDRINDGFGVNRGIYMKKNGIARHFHCGGILFAPGKMHNDQFFKAALYEGHIGRVVSASSVPVLKLMDRDRIIDAGESRRSEHIVFDPVFFHIIQTIIIRVMKGSQDQLRRRLHLYLQALPGHAGKDDPVFGNPLFQNTVRDLREFFLCKK